MSRKCAVCGKKMSFWAPEYRLSNKHTGIVVCDSCDDLLRASRKADKESFNKLKGVVTSDALDNVKEYIKSLKDAKPSEIKKQSIDPVVSEDEQIGVAIKSAINKIKYSDDEKLIKTYCCSIMSCPYGKGYVLVTNKRVIYTGITKKSRFVNEMSIKDVSGINTMYGKRIKLTRLLFGIMFTIIGISSIILSYKQSLQIGVEVFDYALNILFWIGTILSLTSKKKCFKLAIYSSQAMGTPINVTTIKSDTHNAMFSLSAEPTNETDKMMCELGALIHDIQTMGDNAIEKWRD